MIGQAVSHYKILEKLGEGGMGVVYKAQDMKLDRLVALKFLPQQVAASEGDKSRFIQEARAAAALNHPNICTIYGIEENEAQSFIAMEFVEGKTLKQRVDEGPLKLKEAMDIAAQIAHGLQAAHEKGIVHRDMKSANVMITEKGDAKIMDFGLAKLAKGSALLTKQGTTLGTIAYMSPEQAQGDKVDRRTDIWSLGVVLYEMITGRLPFRGEFEQAMIYSLLNEDPEPVTALRSGLPMELERVISKAMAKDPNRRYQHADELAVDLKAIRAATPSTSKVLNSVSMPVASGLHVKRATLPLWLSGGMFGAALLVGAGIMWVLKPDPIIEPQPVARFVIPFETDSPADGMTSCALSPDGTKLAYKLRRRSNDFLYVRDMDKLDARLVLSAQGIDQSMVFFSPDGRWLAFFSQGKLSKLSLAGGPPIAICDAPNTGSGS